MGDDSLEKDILTVLKNMVMKILEFKDCILNLN